MLEMKEMNDETRILDRMLPIYLPKPIGLIERMGRNPLLWLSFILLIYYIISIRVDDPIQMPNLPTIFRSSPSKKYLSSRLAAPSRLGNHLFELAALLGISKALNRTPVFFVEDHKYSKMLKNTKEAAPGLINQFLVLNGSVPPSTRNTTFNTRCCIYMDPKVLENIDDQYLHLTGNFYQSWKYFPGMRNEFRGYMKKPTNNFGILPKSDKNTFITCVHARRGDFLSVGYAAANDTFIRYALKYIDKKENTKKSKKITVIFGDNPDFMRKLFNDTRFSNDKPQKNMTTTTHFVSQNTPSDDLVYSKENCDIVLISAPLSTFGWWMGFLSKNNKVYYMDIRATKDNLLREGKINPTDFYIPHWTPLKFTPDFKNVEESPK